MVEKYTYSDIRSFLKLWIKNKIQICFYKKKNRIFGFSTFCIFLDSDGFGCIFPLINKQLTLNRNKILLISQVRLNSYLAPMNALGSGIIQRLIALWKHCWHPWTPFTAASGSSQRETISNQQLQTLSGSSFLSLWLLLARFDPPELPAGKNSWCRAGFWNTVTGLLLV